MSADHMIIELSREQYAVPVSEVLGLLQYDASSVYQPFSLGEVVQGYMTYLGQVIPVVDLRRALGLRSLDSETAEFVETLDQRKIDHINWLNELEASIKEDREFTLTVDPHACKFGKWYDSLRASPDRLHEFTNGYGPLEGVLRAFDPPHRRIHGIAREVRALQDSGQHDEAMRVIEQTRDRDLHMMIDLFDRARAMYTSMGRTLLLVLRMGGERAGVIIDRVHEIAAMPTECEQDVQVDSPLIRTMALPDPSGRPVAILDVGALDRSIRIPAA